MGDIPVIHLLECNPVKENSDGVVETKLPSSPVNSIEELFQELKRDTTVEATVHLLYAIFSAKVKQTFHKLNVHAALTPTEVKDQLEPAISQAKDLQEKYYQKKQAENQNYVEDMPFVTVSKGSSLNL